MTHPISSSTNSSPPQVTEPEDVVYMLDPHPPEAGKRFRGIAAAFTFSPLTGGTSHFLSGSAFIFMFAFIAALAVLTGTPSIGWGKCSIVNAALFQEYAATVPGLVSISDTDGDGSVSTAEFDSFVTLFDFNGSGHMERFEMQLAELSLSHSFMVQFDKDRDGRIGRAEFKEISKRLDANSDNDCSGEEIARFMIDFNPTLLAGFDLNRNGRLDDAEWADAVARRTSLIESPDACCPLDSCPEKRKKYETNPRLMKIFDRDGDKKLSDQEWEALQKAAKRTRERLIKSFDRDGDNRIDCREKLELYKEIRKNK